MGTAMNCRVTVYKGVPLVKGGTEVLYASGSSASSVIAGYSVATFNNYYYTREDEGKIQVESDIAALEGANYVSFQNISHGGKLYFGFIDHLRYVNDGTTEIQFTIDPFPTFVGDCVENDYCYVIRNTVESDVRGNYLSDDFLPKTAGINWGSAASSVATFGFTHPTLFFVCETQIGTYLTVSSSKTGIQYESAVTTNIINDILTNNGTILGCYLLPLRATQTSECVYSSGGVIHTLSITSIGTYSHQKIYTGVYNKVMLKTSQGSKFYDVEGFADPTNIQFDNLFIKVPTPCIHIYPKNYKGLADNLAEGITVTCPSIPIATPTVYTNAQLFSDIWGTVASAATGAVSGAAIGAAGGGIGALPGAAIGLIGGMLNAAKNQIMTKFEPSGITSSNFPLINASYQIQSIASIVSPDANTLKGIDDYFSYYGYQINYEMKKADINTRNGAFLQTGSEFLSGSEADDEINARLMSGIKIKKQF